jgi:calmodulin
MSDNKKYTEYKMAFDIFDSDKDGYLTMTELDAVMKSFGVELNESEIENLFYETCTKDNMKVKFNDFLNMLNKRCKEFDVYEEYIEAFKIFSNHENRIPLDMLEQILKSLGDGLTGEEIDNFLLEANVKGDGYIDYKDFVRLMLCK